MAHISANSMPFSKSALRIGLSGHRVIRISDGERCRFEGRDSPENGSRQSHGSPLRRRATAYRHPRVRPGRQADAGEIGGLLSGITAVGRDPKGHGATPNRPIRYSIGIGRAGCGRTVDITRSAGRRKRRRRFDLRSNRSDETPVEQPLRSCNQIAAKQAHFFQTLESSLFWQRD
jgi:hypothetical protein